MARTPTGEEKLTIQQVAQATELSPHTLRYYERAGLMREEVARDESSGYRRYRWYHVDWINFIKRLRSTGMPIRDIQRYTHLVKSGDQTVADRLQILQHHRYRVEANLREIQQNLAAITAKIADYERSEMDHSISCTLPSEVPMG